VDDYLWRRLDKWARRRHPNKPRRWVTARYFGAFHPTRRDRWVFGDRDSGAYLHRYAWTKIVRHAPVPGRNSPDDPALAQYWADRRRKRRPPQLAPSWERALRTQHRRCPLCAEPLLPVDDPPDSCTQWETWYRGIRTALAHQAITQTSSGPTIHRLVHTDCARRHPGVRSHDPDQRMHDA
jgi:RNA-directed DNA polymerase